MKKVLSLLILFLGGISFLQAQTTFGLKLSEVSNDGTDYVVKLEIQMNGTDASLFQLGSSSLQFEFPQDALSNPVVTSFAPLDPPFYIQPFASTPLGGECSYNIELAAANFGIEIAESPAWTEVGQISFTIDDANLLEDLSWSYNGGTTGTVLYLDDEATQIFVASPEMDNLLFVPMGAPNVRITMVNPNTNQITFKNFGDVEEDITSWRLCSNFNYTNGVMGDHSTINVISGDFILSPDEEMTVEWTPATGFRLTGDDIGLYYATGAFGNASSMVDFTQYLSSGNGRESVAVAKGIWTVDDFVAGDAPYVYTGDGTENGVQFWQGTVVIDDCSDLLISEYGEPDGGNGKYMELYNASDATIDLADYAIWKIGNGGDWPESTLDLTGSILSGTTFVIANNDVDVPGANLYDTGLFNFNGDDAMGLAKGGVLIDAIGQAGEDPGAGFEVAGIASGTQNHTLIRKSTVLAPNADWNVTAGTDETDSQWEVVTYGTSNVGLHTTSCVEATTDADGDGVDDDVDNCVSIANPNQEDLDEDGTGDVCDSDMDGDGVLNDNDCAPMDGAIYPGAACDDDNPETLNDVIQNNCDCEGNIPVAPCTELFISEYGEPDGGNGKYIEIYNASNASVDLSSYSLWKIGNGGTWPETYLNLTGMLDSDATYVIANNDTDVPGADLYESFIINFNGDDAMGLAKDSVLIDAVGQEGPDPGAGFDVAGIANGTANYTLIRKPTVQAPNVSWTASAGTDSISSEWLVVAYGQSDLGMHTSPCFSGDDMDFDGIVDAEDNCPTIANPNQEDLDEDNIGDVCDDDIDGDGVNNDNDCDPMDANVSTGESSSFTMVAFECGNGAEVFELFPIGVEGVFSIAPPTMDGATIDQATGMISNGTPGNTYNVNFEPTSICYTSSMQMITMLMDTEGPTFETTPMDEFYECEDVIPDPEFPMVIDNCDDNPTVDFVENETSDACSLIITRVWTATDASGNSTSVTQVITIDDTTAPTIASFDADIDLPCDDFSEILITATDNCNEVQITYEDTEMADATCYGQIIRTYTATDVCGNSATATQIIHLVDTVDPEFVGFPEDIILDCGEEVPAVAAVTGMDNCDDSPVVVYLGETVEGTCPMTITRSWSITDCSGNTVTSEQTISFVDTTAIVITSSPSDMTIECDEMISEVLPTATTTEICGIVSFTFTDTEETDGCETVITRTFIGTDECGNLVQTIQTIILIDTTAPVFMMVPSDITIACDDALPTDMATAVDNCSSVEITFDDTQSTVSCETTITRTFTATDVCGNVVTASQEIYLVDSTDPMFTSFPEDMNLACGDDVPAVASPMGEDNCSEVMITYDGEVVTGDCPTTIIRTWTISDDCGNSTTSEQSITFTNDVVPEFTFIPADVTIDCDEAIPTEMATATSASPCENVVVTSMDVESPQDCGYILTRTFTATDGCGTIIMATQTITVMDLTAPVVISTPADVTVECESDVPMPGTPEAEDNCDNTLNIVLTESVSGACPQTITRTWAITDDCDNTTTTTQIITVNDTTDPVFTTFPNNQDLTCDDDIPTAVTPDATDNCDNEVTVTLTEDITGDCPLDMTITRTWTATDDCGNMVSQTQTITFSSTDNIDDLSQENLSMSLSPVPATKDLLLTINANTQDQLDIIIYNSIGQVIIRENASIQMGDNVLTFDVSSYENGMYFVKVFGNQSMNTISFIKE